MTLMKYALLGLVLGAGLVMSGCSKQEKTLSGVALGAGTGALIGGAAGGTGGALVGAGLGGVVGGVIGHNVD